ncbi:Transcription initiation factor TFIID subunit 9 [Entomophthora muscae]|uniref:Transcription initiation factor TFIID subunit 9 n=1 Tax=Entomophthora muscae TaxID=34485 RepID=A0ACC2SL17_9FUNG|nr:Transcription initiation factor TFIID subunit 9 [Entomophthora muscae]
MTKANHPPSPDNSTVQPEQTVESSSQPASVPQVLVSEPLGSQNLPKSAQTISIILSSFGIMDVQPNVIYQLQEFAHRYTCDVLQDAQILSDHCGKASVDFDDVSEAIHGRIHHSFAPPPPQDFLDELAQTVNSTPLPPIQEKFGVRLPPEKYCLTAANYQIIPDSSSLGGSRYNSNFKNPKVSQVDLGYESKEQRQSKATSGSNDDYDSIQSREGDLKRSESAEHGSQVDNKLTEDEDEDMDFEEVDDSIKPSD